MTVMVPHWLLCLGSAAAEGLSSLESVTSQLLVVPTITIALDRETVQEDNDDRLCRIIWLRQVSLAESWAVRS